MIHLGVFLCQRKLYLQIIVGVLGMFLWVSQGWAQTDAAHRIQWRSQTWYTNQPAPELPAALTITAYPDSVLKGYYFVQFKRKITKSMRQTAAAAGAELLTYVPNNTYLVRMSTEAKTRLAALPDVQYVGIYQPAQRVEPKLLQRILADRPAPPARRRTLQPSAPAPEPPAQTKLKLTVLVFKGEDLNAIRQAVIAAGGTVLAASEGKRRSKLRVEIPQGQALQLPLIHGVSWIEEYGLFEPLNDASRLILDTGTAWAPVNNLRGAGQTVAISDTGLDNGLNDAALHNDFQGRITSIVSWPVQNIYGALNPGADDGASDLDSGHGTHVAGSAVGNGSLSAGTYSGVAPDATIVFQALEQYSDYAGTDDDGYSHTGIPNNLNDLFQQAYAAGARIHTNSWGRPVQGEYTADSEEVDEFVWDNPDMLILFSAGNSGVDTNPQNNVVDLGSLGSPGSAKNCLTVGATENNRPAIPNTWSSRYGNVINADRCANNAAGMAAFSSRGPANANTPAAADDRIKPDVVAPGTYVISTRSRSAANTVWFTDDIESGINGWTTTGTWAQTTAASHSATHCWHDTPAGNYGNNTTITLTSPVQNLSGGGQGEKAVRFWCRYDLGTGDRWRLDLSKDGGATWPIGLEVTGDQADWELMTVGMAGFASYASSATFRLRFSLISDNDGNNGDGLYIDDVQIVEGAFGHGLLSDYGVAATGSAMNADYFFMGGTSMSTPLTAGCAAAVRQYYADEIGLAYLSAALLRATLITGAAEIAPGQYGAGANREIPAAPNNVEGWGRVNLNQTLFPAAPAQLDFKDELAGVDDGVTHHYALNITDNTVPAVITLVYHDAPGAALQNNVDLSITPPGGGATLFPNGLAAPDTQNNVEQVVIANPLLGAYTVHVEGQNITDGPQPYALVTRAGGTLADRDPVDVMLALDISGSMLSPAAPGGESKLNVLKQAVELFTRLWTAVAAPGDRLGVAYFRTLVNEFQSGGQVLLDVLPNAQTIINDVNGQTTVPANLTAMGGGLQACINRLLPETHPKNIILFTDGMQNVNPMVQALAGGGYKIDLEAGRTNSNVDPTDPPTQLNDALGVKINTIGVGATDPYMDLMDGIAASTHGLSKLTQAPDNDLRRFFVEDLIDALREHSPQLIGYRHGQLAGTSGSETFTIGKNAQKLVLKLSGQPAGQLNFQVYKDGENLTRLGKMLSGTYYKIFSIDLPARQKIRRIPSQGLWTLHITGAANARYEAAAIVDEPLLKCDFSLDQKDYAVGEPLKLGVRLSLGNRPVTQASVKARVRRPTTGIGTLLSTIASPAGDQTREPGASADQIKFQALAQQPGFYNRLQPGQQEILFTNQGDGSYAARYTHTLRPGTYTVVFDVSGQGTDLGDFQRTETRSTLVRFGQAELEPSEPEITLLEETADQLVQLLTLRPKDRYGNYLGPGYQDRITFILSTGELLGVCEDRLNGRYTQKFSVPQGQDPVITITVMGQPVYQGPLSQLPTVKSWAVSLHGGLTLPLGAFNLDYDPDLSLALDLGYRLKAQWWLMAYLGYSAFQAGHALVADTYWWHASANLKYRLLDQALTPYVQGGLGIYHAKTGDTHAGANLGLGLDYDLTSRWTLELGGDVHTLFGQDLRFGQVQAGVIFKF